MGAINFLLSIFQVKYWILPIHAFVLGYFLVAMQGYNTVDSFGYGSELANVGQYAPNHFVSVSTQNSFAPLQDWVGYPTGIDEPNPEQMDIQWVPVRNKRRRFNTASPSAGTGSINFSSLKMEENFALVFEKLNKLEQSNNEIMKSSQLINSIQSKVDVVEQRTVNHELFLKVLAYKSIDIEARSRRCNLIFHGLKESKNENLAGKLEDFLWQELCIDSNDLLIDRYHRLGSFDKAKQRQRTDTPCRPIIIAFSEYRYIERILDAAYMLKGTGYSVTKDYPKEIVAARQRLLPMFKAERQNSNNRVSLEYPARLVVNGRCIKDEFPDWFQVLEYDRYNLARGDYSMPKDRPRQNQTVQPPVYSGLHYVSPGSGSAITTTQPPVRPMSQPIAQQQQQTQQPCTRPPGDTIGTGGAMALSPVNSNVQQQSYTRTPGVLVGTGGANALSPVNPSFQPQNQQTGIRPPGVSIGTGGANALSPVNSHPGIVQQQTAVRPNGALTGTGGASGTALSPVNSYANVASSVAQQKSYIRPPSFNPNVGQPTSTPSAPARQPNVPPYMLQNRLNGSMYSQSNTTNTTRCTNFHTTSLTSTMSTSRPLMNTVNSNGSVSRDIPSTYANVD